MTLKKGDSVVVICGKDKGKSGTILQVMPEQNKVLVDGVNIVKRATKAKNAQEKSGIVSKPAPIDASNVMIVCPSCKKATKVAHGVVDGKKVRVCKKCGLTLDKAYIKEAKKQAKQEVKTDVKEVKRTKASAKKATAEVKPQPQKEEKAVKKTSTKKTETSAKETAKKTETKITAKKAESKTQKSKTATKTK